MLPPAVRAFNPLKTTEVTVPPYAYLTFISHDVGPYKGLTVGLTVGYHTSSPDKPYGLFLFQI